MRRALPLVLAVVVCLAGCGGFAGTDPATSDPATATPAAVPTDGPVDRLPGVTANGISDSTALADANAEALDGTSFTLRGYTAVTTANGTELANGSSVTRVSANHSRSVATALGDSPYTHPIDHPITKTNRWHNGTHTLVRAVGPNETTYLVPPFAPTPEGIPGSLGWYYGEEQTESVTVSTTDDGVRLRIDVRPSDGVNTSLAGVPVDLTEQTVTVWLTDDGRVERYRVDYVGRLASDPDVSVEGTSVSRYVGVGETTVERPSWVTAARNATVVTGP